MSIASVLYWTNWQRTQNGDTSLSENAILDKAALAKAHDILVNQYFAHTSPAGVGVTQLAKSVGYTYVLIGENLARGDFADGKALVDAWMASPEHRANILKPGYREIGIAVIKGVYQGTKEWVGVQEFGTPLSACPAPDEGLNATINTYRTQIDALKQTITDSDAAINAMSPYDPAYRQKISEYNSLVSFTNSLIVKLKGFVATYNGEVNTFNTCVSGLTGP